MCRGNFPEGGLPVGLQLTAHNFQEAKLLQVAMPTNRRRAGSRERRRFHDQPCPSGKHVGEAAAHYAAGPTQGLKDPAHPELVEGSAPGAGRRREPPFPTDEETRPTVRVPAKLILRLAQDERISFIYFERRIIMGRSALQSLLPGKGAPKRRPGAKETTWSADGEAD